MNYSCLLYFYFIMDLHIPTMFVMVMVASAVMAVSLTAVAVRRHSDLLIWSFALMLQLLTYVLISLRGQIPDVLSIVLANTALSASLALYGAGLYRFHATKIPAFALSVPVWLTAVGFAWAMNDYRLRTLIASALWLLQCLFLLWVLWRFHSNMVGRGRYFIWTAVVLFALMMVFRLAAITIGWDQSQDFKDPTRMVVTTYLGSLSSTLLLAIGALTMVQERLAHQLSQSEARYRQLIDSATEGICVIESGCFRLVNPCLATLLGYAPTDLLDRPFLPLIAPADQALAAQAHQQRVSGEIERLPYVLRVLTQGHALRWVQISGVAIEWQGKRATLNFVSDVTAQHHIEEQIRSLAFHDTLTQLPNRRLYLDHLELAIATGQRTAVYNAVVFMDLDNFKPLNDRHGHHVGDLLLIEVAQRLSRNVRATDTVARFGGDEFVLLLTDLGSTHEAAHQRAEQWVRKILAVLAQAYVLRASDAETDATTVTHHCTATAGVTLFAKTTDSAQTLLERADAAMYAAKQAGRNTVAFSAADAPFAQVC